MITPSLYFGDCMDGMALLSDHCVDMILCDLPYGITARNKWDSPLDLVTLWKEYSRLLKPNGVVVLTASQPFTTSLILSNREWFKYEWVWVKTTATGFLNAKKQPLRAHESVLVFYRAQPTYHPQKTSGHPRKVSTAAHKKNSLNTLNYGKHGLVSYDSTERYPRDVITFSLDKQRSALHPTQKPVALFEYLIKTYTNEGDIVLDNCAGSGTTGVACVNTNRLCLLMEKEREYVDIICERLGIKEASNAVSR